MINRLVVWRCIGEPQAHECGDVLASVADSGFESFEFYSLEYFVWYADAEFCFVVHGFLKK